MADKQYDQVLQRQEALRLSALGKVDESIAIWSKLIEYLETKQDNTAIAYAKLQMAMTACQSASQKTDTYTNLSQSLLSQVISIYQNEQDYLSSGLTEKTAGDLYTQCQDYPNAIIYYDSAIKLLELADSPANLGQTIIDRAYVQTMIDSQPVAPEIIEEAINGTRQDPANGLARSMTMYRTACLLAKAKNYKQAYEMVTLSQSWFGADHKPIVYGLMLYRTAIFLKRLLVFHNVTNIKYQDELVAKFAKTIDVALQNKVQSELSTIFPS